MTSKQSGNSQQLCQTSCFRLAYIASYREQLYPVLLIRLVCSGGSHFWAGQAYSKKQYNYICRNISFNVNFAVGFVGV